MQYLQSISISSPDRRLSASGDENFASFSLLLKISTAYPDAFRRSAFLRSQNAKEVPLRSHPLKDTPSMSQFSKEHLVNRFPERSISLKSIPWKLQYLRLQSSRELTGSWIYSSETKLAKSTLMREQFRNVQKRISVYLLCGMTKEQLWKMQLCILQCSKVVASKTQSSKVQSSYTTPLSVSARYLSLLNSLPINGSMLRQLSVQYCLL